MSLKDSLYLFSEFSTIVSAMFFAALQFFMPIRELTVIMIMAVLLDTCFGIYRCWKLGTKVTSHRLFINLVGKLGMYVGTLMLMFMIDTYLVGGSMFGVSLFLSKTVTIIYTFIEIKSINESSVMVGNKSIWTIIEELTKRAMKFKTDIKKLVE